MGREQMNYNKQMMLRRLSSIHFALVELNLFLDTHPYNKEALMAFKEYENKFKALLKDYQQHFGPITARETIDNTEWDWIKGPWPWESDKEMKK